MGQSIQERTTKWNLCGRQSLKNLKRYRLLKRCFKSFKGCLPQISLGPLLNTLSHIFDMEGIWYICGKNFLDKGGGTLHGKIEGQIHMTGRPFRTVGGWGGRGSDPLGHHVFFLVIPFIISYQLNANNSCLDKTFHCLFYIVGTHTSFT